MPGKGSDYNERKEFSDKWNKRVLLPAVMRYHKLESVQEVMQEGPLDTVGVDGKAGGRRVALRCLDGKRIPRKFCPSPTLQCPVGCWENGHNHAGCNIAHLGIVSEYWYAFIWDQVRGQDVCILGLDVGQWDVDEGWGWSEVRVNFDYAEKAFRYYPKMDRAVLFEQHSQQCPAGRDPKRNPTRNPKLF